MDKKLSKEKKLMSGEIYGLPKTKTTVQKFINLMLNWGGIVSIACYTLLLLNTAWVFENNKMVIIFRGIELFLGIEMLAFYLSYSRTVKKVIKKRQNYLSSSKRYDKLNMIARIEKRHTKIKIDMLFSGCVTYFVLLLICRAVSFITVKYGFLIDMYHSQTIIQGILHVGFLCVPFFVWNKQEVNDYFSDVTSVDAVCSYTAGRVAV